MKGQTDAEVVRDYLNNVVNETDDMTKHERELMEWFDLERCGNCKQFNLDEHMDHHKWDLGLTEEKVCEGCRNDE